MLSSSAQRDFLNELVVARHGELARFVSVLSAESERLERRGKALKVITIILGAFSASQAVIGEIFENPSSLASVVFALIGIAIAAIAGVEAAFKFETRAVELRTLAAKCQAARFQHNSEWAYRIAIAEPEEGIAAARELLAVQDQTLSEVQLEAAKLGISIVPKIDSDSGQARKAAERREHQLRDVPFSDRRMGVPDDDLPPPDADLPPLDPVPKGGR